MYISWKIITSGSSFWVELRTLCLFLAACACRTTSASPNAAEAGRSFPFSTSSWAQEVLQGKHLEQDLHVFCCPPLYELLGQLPSSPQQQAPRLCQQPGVLLLLNAGPKPLESSSFGPQLQRRRWARRWRREMCRLHDACQPDGVWSGVIRREANNQIIWSKKGSALENRVQTAGTHPQNIVFLQCSAGWKAGSNTQNPSVTILMDERKTQTPSRHQRTFRPGRFVGVLKS